MRCPGRGGGPARGRFLRWRARVLFLARKIRRSERGNGGDLESIKHLVHMASGIGGFFDGVPDRDGALHGIWDHMRMFWAPRMREQLTAHCADMGDAGITAIVAEALARYPILSRAIPVETTDPREAAERHKWDGASASF